MTLDALEKASMMAAKYDSEWLSSGMVKVFYDGVLDSWTAVMVDDYADRPGWRGEPLFSPEQFAEVAIEADRRGLQIAVHAIGDGAVRAVLDGYEAARKAERQARQPPPHRAYRGDDRGGRAALCRARRARLDAAAASAGRHGLSAGADACRASAASAGR